MTHASAAPTSVSRSRYLLIAAVAAVTQMLLMIPGYNENGDFQVGEWLIVLLISLVVSGALFIFVVPNGGAVSALVPGLLRSRRCWSSGRVSRCRSRPPQR
jgi:hypothetical protein